MTTKFQRDFAAHSDFALRPIACVDVDIFRCEIAGPHARGPAARIQVDHDRNKGRQHLAMRHPLVESMFTAVVTNGKTGELDVHSVGFEFDAGAARRGNDPAPVRIGAGESCFDQR